MKSNKNKIIYKKCNNRVIFTPHATPPLSILHICTEIDIN